MYQANFLLRGNIIMSRNIGERENFKLLIKSTQQSRQWQQRIYENVQFMLRYAQLKRVPSQGNALDETRTFTLYVAGRALSSIGIVPQEGKIEHVKD